MVDHSKWSNIDADSNEEESAHLRCPGCEAYLRREDAQRHWETCPAMPEVCHDCGVLCLRDDKATHEAECPATQPSRAAPADGLGPLPYGWECRWDPAYARYFYVDYTTQTTTWERPPAPAASSPHASQQAPLPTRSDSEVARELQASTGRPGPHCLLLHSLPATCRRHLFVLPPRAHRPSPPIRLPESATRTARAGAAPPRGRGAGGARARGAGDSALTWPASRLQVRLSGSAVAQSRAIA